MSLAAGHMPRLQTQQQLVPWSHTPRVIKCKALCCRAAYARPPIPSSQVLHEQRKQLASAVLQLLQTPAVGQMLHSQGNKVCVATAAAGRCPST